MEIGWRGSGNDYLYHDSAISVNMKTMKNNSFLARQTDSILHSVSVRDYFSQKIIASESPFLPVSFSARMKIAFMNGWLWITERLLGSKIYIENDVREFFFIDSRIRSLILFLMEKKIVSSWERMPLLPDFPPLISYEIKMGPHRLPSGNFYYPQGNRGDGVGHTPNEALFPALAETIERYSLYVWDPKKIARGSFESLRARASVHPSLFTFFSEKQLALSSFTHSLVTPDTEMGWMPAVSFISGRKHLIPAQLVYILYSEEYRDEPYFWQSTTNGAAAGVSFEEASYRAICEAIERDGLFCFWLNKIAPPVINLESIPFPGIQKKIATIKQYKLELYILDITTDLCIPSFCAVLIDRFGKRAVSMGAATGVNPEQVLEKLIFEVSILPHGTITENDSLTFQSVRENYSDIRTFEQRELFWSKQESISQIEFFLQGKKKDFSEISMKYAYEDTKTKLHKIKDILKEKRYNCFLADVTSQEARQAGLSVVKAVLPQLVPAYFNEKDKPLGVKRLFTLPVTLGYRKQPLGESELNPLPHPFL